MAELLSSKVVKIEEPPRLRTIPTTSVSVTAMNGRTEKGPVRIPTLFTSFDEFVDVHGGHIAGSTFTAEVEQAFLNGTQQLWISRVVHYTDILDPLTKISVAASVSLVDTGATNVMDVVGKYDGTYANGPTSLRVIITAATSGVATEFNLSVEFKGVIVEVFPNLVNDDTSTNDASKVINAASGSKFISIVFVAAGVSPPVVGTFDPVGGDDGFTGLADTDYVGSSAGETGFFAFDRTNGIRIIASPDRPSGSVQESLVDYAETTRNGSMFAIVTLPAGLTAAQAVTHVETTFALFGRSEFGAMYWPHVLIRNPNKTVFGDSDTITVPVTTSAAGVYAQVDGNRPGGVYDEPAGIERGGLVGVIDVETDEVLDERKRDLVYPKRINPVSRIPGTPFFLDGVRVLKGDFNFPTIAQRRGVVFIAESVKDGMEVYRFRANDDETRDEVARTIEAFLLTQFRQRAFRGATPKSAFFVDSSEAVNPPTEVQAGRLNVRIGLATQRPAEFIILRFSQDLRDVEAEIAAAG